MNNLNELTTNTNGGTLTVVGTTTSPATSVTVNGGSATLYGDATFAAAGLPLTTTYTATAQDSYGRRSGGPKSPWNQVKCLHRGYRWTKYVIPRTDPNASLRPPMDRKNSKIQGLTRQPPGLALCAPCALVIILKPLLVCHDLRVEYKILKSLQNHSTPTPEGIGVAS
ncbi:MAG: hypothetical protein ABSG59_18480 [Verrucomicrobiota bacterium]